MKASRLRRGWLLAIMVGAMVGWSTAADPPRREAAPAGLGHRHRHRQLQRPHDPRQRDGRRPRPEGRPLVPRGRVGESPPAPVPGLRQRQPGQARGPRRQYPADQDNLNWAVDEWLLPRAKAGDLVVIYFAGQAETVSSAAPRSEPRVDHFLLPIDAIKTDLKRTGWSIDGSSTSVPCGGSRWSAGWRRPSATATPPLPRGSPRRRRARGDEWLRRLTRWPGVSAWLSNRPMGRPAVDPADPFTSALRRGLGDPDQRKTCRRASSSSSRIRGWDSRASWRWAGSRGAEPLEGRFPSTSIRPVPRWYSRRAMPTGSRAWPDGRQSHAHHASQDSTVRAWSLVDGALLHVWSGQTAGATAVGLSGDDSGWSSGAAGARSRSATCAISRSRRRRGRHTPCGWTRSRCCPTAGISSRSTATAGPWATFGSRRWTPRPGPAGAPMPGRRLRRDTGHGTVAALFHDGTVRLFDSRGGGAPVDTRVGRPSALAFSPDGRTLALGFPPARSPSATSPATRRPSPDGGLPVRRLAIARRLGRRGPRAGPAACGPRATRPGRAGRKLADLRTAPPRAWPSRPTDDTWPLAPRASAAQGLEARRRRRPRRSTRMRTPGPPSSASPSMAARWSAERARWQIGPGTSTPRRRGEQSWTVAPNRGKVLRRG